MSMLFQGTQANVAISGGVTVQKNTVVTLCGSRSNAGDIALSTGSGASVGAAGGAVVGYFSSSLKLSSGKLPTTGLVSSRLLLSRLPSRAASHGTSAVIPDGKL